MEYRAGPCGRAGLNSPAAGAVRRQTPARQPIRGLAAALFLAGAAAMASPADPAKTWGDHCVRCHGDDGKGETRQGRKLHIKDLTSPRLQTRLTDERMRKSILRGSRDNDGKEKMPPFRGKLSDEELQALITYVRTLKDD